MKPQLIIISTNIAALGLVLVGIYWFAFTLAKNIVTENPVEATELAFRWRWLVFSLPILNLAGVLWTIPVWVGALYRPFGFLIVLLFWNLMALLVLFVVGAVLFLAWATSRVLR